MSAGEESVPHPAMAVAEQWFGFWQQMGTLGWQSLAELQTTTDARQMRSRWLAEWSQATEAYYRSPAFLESMRAGLKIANDVKVFQNQQSQQLVRQLGLPLASDVQELSDRLRRMEDELTAQLQAIREAQDRLPSGANAQGTTT